MTVRFCDRYVEKRSRTRDQMAQAARSSVQNIAEGSQRHGDAHYVQCFMISPKHSSPLGMTAP
ncbi:MAG: four helix bundle protein [Acidobacteriia bacterium]|nr:four helix bundle protein [Terriglobia bacterium]